MTFQVDQSKCTKCGICGEVCPGGIVKIGEKGPELLFSKACLACGHCVAVCPQSALDSAITPLAEQVILDEFPVLNPQTAGAFLRSRRAIRSYKKERVDRGTLEQLINIGRFAPSGGNTQGISYIIIDNPEIMEKITAFTVDWMEEQIKAGAAWAKNYSGIVKAYRKTGRDVILRGAPHLLVATALKDFRQGRDNGHFALSYVELFATSLGLGSCWAGFVEMCAGAKYPPLLELLRLPAEMSVVGALMVGYPKYKYLRLANRNNLNLTWL